MTSPEFKKNPRQQEALEVLYDHRHSLLYGGSRSGKTSIIIRNMFLRGMKRKSKHLMVRFRFNHARISLAHETVPMVLETCFPRVPIKKNKVDGFWEVPVLKGGGTSEVWLGGTDEKHRIDKILGNEYSTIFFNECSQIPFDAVLTLWTRLAENSGLDLKCYYDCNPPGKKHWTNLLFHKGELPDGTPHKLDVGSMQINPKDNPHLPPEYIAILEALPRRQRQRFLEGLYLDDVEGALWTDRMITLARLKEPAELVKTVVAVDPAVTNNPKSDECGIVVCSKDMNGEGVVQRDLSLKASTRAWAQRVVDTYHSHTANYVVAEVNQGGDLVEDAVHNIDPYVKVKKVHAAVGKFARAEPVAMLYEQEKVAHLADFPKLDAELTETVFNEGIKASPNRLDAMVWGLTDLIIGSSSSRFHFGTVI